MNISITFFKTLFASLLCLSLFIGQAFAASAHVINLAGKQRMLSQKMTKEMLLIALDKDKQANIQALKKTMSLFNKTLNGLIHGDNSLNLPVENNKGILRSLKKVDKSWQPFYDIGKKVAASGKLSSQELDKIAVDNLKVLKDMNRSVRKMEKLVGSSGDSKKATVVNLAGKQRMLSQKISKDVFLIKLGYKPDATRVSLLESVNLFETTLKGLKSGNAELGLAGTKNPVILKQLNVVQGIWDQIKPIFIKISENKNSTISDEDIRLIANKNIPLLKEMNKAVGLIVKEKY